MKAWFDGRDYWLTDGFHRVAAWRKCGMKTIRAVVFHGALADAQWDSYSSNRDHGLRRNQHDIDQVIKRALLHPAAITLSNVQIAKHLGVPEATLRRWRKRLAPSHSAESRVAVRGNSTYLVRLGNIGKTRGPQHRRPSVKMLQDGIEEMHASATPDTSRLINIVRNWLTGRSTPSDCLQAIEAFLSSSRGTL